MRKKYILQFYSRLSMRLKGSEVNSRVKLFKTYFRNIIFPTTINFNFERERINFPNFFFFLLRIIFSQSGEIILHGGFWISNRILRINLFRRIERRSSARCIIVTAVSSRISFFYFLSPFSPRWLRVFVSGDQVEGLTRRPLKNLACWS